MFVWATIEKKLKKRKFKEKTEFFLKNTYLILILVKSMLAGP